MVIRLFKNIPAAAFGCAAFTVLSSGALAFFPPVVPQGSDQVKVSPVSPIIAVPPPPPPVIVVPPVPPPIVVVPKVIVDPPIVPHCPPLPPSQVPEPMTLISGLVGLGVLGAAALKKKLRKPAPTDTAKSD